MYSNILVPLKLGPIGEEVLATAVRLAEERGSTVSVLYVLRVPLDLPARGATCPSKSAGRPSRSPRSASSPTSTGIEIDASIVRARALGEAIVAEADERGADLIVMGSAPRWRRQSRFFSPTVDYVLRKAPCEVMVVVYPRGVLEDTTSERVKALIVGCGRVGSALAKTLQRSGWDVSVVDAERGGARGALATPGPASSTWGTGWRSRCSSGRASPRRTP